MDAFALQAANTIIGNDPGAAALEWALGGGSLRFERDCGFAIAGASVRATLAGSAVAPWTCGIARSNEELIVDQIDGGRFLYVAVSGGIDVPVILDSRSTYLPGRFGGFEGRTLRTGDRIGLVGTNVTPSAGVHCAAERIPRYDLGIVHVTPGPQQHLFDDAAWRVLCETEFRVATASDRTGYRLDGAAVTSGTTSLPSEAGCPGAIQIPGDGLPIVLMADAPTVGGYPKIAVVAESDLPILAQRRPGDAVRFERISVEQSGRALRRRHADLQSIRQLAEHSQR
jgi:antagonist of KipI